MRGRLQTAVREVPVPSGLEDRVRLRLRQTRDPVSLRSKPPLQNTAHHSRHSPVNTSRSADASATASDLPQVPIHCADAAISEPPIQHVSGAVSPSGPAPFISLAIPPLKPVDPDMVFTGTGAAVLYTRPGGSKYLRPPALARCRFQRPA
jgi:hypothetical protein